MTLTEKNRDLSIYGHYFEKDGKRIDPKEVFVEMTIEEKNRAVCEMLGICWHEPEDWSHTYQEHCRTPEGYEDIERTQTGKRCKFCKKDMRELLPNPNYILDPVSLLREMMKREDWIEFIDNAGVGLWSNRTYNGIMSEHINIEFLLDDTGKLLCAAGEWMKEQK